MPIYMSQAFRMSSPELAVGQISSFRMKNLVKRLQDYYGFRMRLISVDDYWLNYCVVGQTSANALTELESISSTNEVLFQEGGRFQAMCYLTPRTPDQQGVFIHLYDPDQHGEFQTGFVYC